MGTMASEPRVVVNALGPDGTLHVTDPHSWEVLQSKTPDESLNRGGRLCRTDQCRTTEILAELPGFRCGLAVTPDDAEFVVAPTAHPDRMCFETAGSPRCAETQGTPWSWRMPTSSTRSSIPCGAAWRPQPWTVRASASPLVLVPWITHEEEA